MRRKPTGGVYGWEIGARLSLVAARSAQRELGLFEECRIEQGQQRGRDFERRDAVKAFKPVIGAFVAAAVGFGAHRAQANTIQNVAELCAVYRQVEPQVSLLIGMQDAIVDRKTIPVELIVSLLEIDQQAQNYYFTMSKATAEYLLAKAGPREKRRLSNVKYAEGQVVKTIVRLRDDARECPVYTPLEFPNEKVRISPPFVTGAKKSASSATLAVLER